MEAECVPVVLFVAVLDDVAEVVDVLAAEVGAEDREVGALWGRWLQVVWREPVVQR